MTRALARRVGHALIGVELPWAIFTVALYAAAAILVAVVFPDVSNLWVSLFVLGGTFTSAVTSLITLLRSRQDHP